jgi:hypothetical protein
MAKGAPASIAGIRGRETNPPFRFIEEEGWKRAGILSNKKFFERETNRILYD